MASPVHLTPDILHMVLMQGRRDMLLTAMAVSHVWSDVARRILYHTVKIRTDHTSASLLNIAAEAMESGQGRLRANLQAIQRLSVVTNDATKTSRLLDHCQFVRDTLGADAGGASSFCGVLVCEIGPLLCHPIQRLEGHFLSYLPDLGTLVLNFDSYFRFQKRYDRANANPAKYAEFKDRHGAEMQNIVDACVEQRRTASSDQYCLPALQSVRVKVNHAMSDWVASQPPAPTRCVKITTILVL